MNPLPVFISGMVMGFILTTLGTETRAFEVSRAHAAQIERLQGNQMPPELVRQIALMQQLAEPVLTRSATPIRASAQDEVGAPEIEPTFEHTYFRELDFSENGR